MPSCKIKLIGSAIFFNYPCPVQCNLYFGQGQQHTDNATCTLTGTRTAVAALGQVREACQERGAEDWATIQSAMSMASCSRQAGQCVKR